VVVSVVFEDEETAFAGMEELRRVEGEHRHGAAASYRNRAIPLFTFTFFLHLTAGHSKRMRRVVDDGDIVFLGKALEAGDVADVSIDMHGDDGLGDAGLDERLDFRGVKAERLGVDIGEDGLGADAHERMGCSDEGKRRGDHFAAGKTHRLIAELEGERAVHEEGHVRLGHAEVGGECRGELLHHRAVVREPLVAPDFGAAVLELLQVGEIGAGNEDWIGEAFHGGETGRRD